MYVFFLRSNCSLIQIGYGPPLNKFKIIGSPQYCVSSYFSVPANAFGSMLVSRFSYRVSISSVLMPSKAFAWMAPILLWFRLNISSRSRLFSAGVGTLLSEFCDRSSWVRAFPANTPYYRYIN